MIRRVGWALALTLLAPTLAGAEPGGRSRLDSFLQGFISLTAEFEQHLYDEGGALLETSTGVVAIAKPGMFRWEYRKPYEQTIVSDGKQVWVYDKDLDQVTVNSVDTASAGAPAKLLGEDLDLDAHYIVAELGQKDQNDWVKLTPKEANTQYDGVEIGLDGQGIHRMRLHDNLGQVTEVIFNHGVRNQPIDTAQFHFTPPLDADVVYGTKP